MGERPLPPPHPSLPMAPHARVALAATAALSNPYFQPPLVEYPSQYQPAISSHYAQAYMNFPTAATTTPWGNGPADPSSARRNTFGSKNRQSSQSTMPLHTSAAWYQPGNSKCTVKGCSFTASPKTLEIHMMDRHLIYPPEWEKRQKKPDWDADPSLKGKSIPIQGTTLVLDSPEVLEAWIAERKKRWPTGARVEDKKRKMEEAIARGQLSVEDNNLRKRRRTEESHNSDRTGDRGGHNPSNRARLRGHGRGTDSGWGGRGRSEGASRNPSQRPRHSPPPSPSNMAAMVASHSGTDTESDVEPEVVSSKGPHTDNQSATLMISDTGDTSSSEGTSIQQPAKLLVPDAHKARKLQLMKKEPHNPFASRPTLLRNLLLPEIRMTISNLSQAIRFLADNNFLRGVELKAGEASEKMIEVIGGNIGT